MLHSAEIMVQVVLHRNLGTYKERLGTLSRAGGIGALAGNVAKEAFRQVGSSIRNQRTHPSEPQL